MTTMTTMTMTMMTTTTRVALVLIAILIGVVKFEEQFIIITMKKSEKGCVYNVHLSNQFLSEKLQSMVLINMYLSGYLVV